jgi:hypothetical protein
MFTPVSTNPTEDSAVLVAVYGQPIQTFVGLFVGKSVGELVVGLEVGLALVGFAVVGLFVGLVVVGWLVGDTVDGDLVVGVSVGAIVVGRADGFLVGLPDGIAVVGGTGDIVVGEAVGPPCKTEVLNQRINNTNPVIVTRIARSRNTARVVHHHGDRSLAISSREPINSSVVKSGLVSAIPAPYATPPPPLCEFLHTRWRVVVFRMKERREKHGI